MNIKEDLYNTCEVFIDNRLKTVQHTIKDIQKSLTSETKSSAGDKHETGRAMLQLEREKAGNQLAEIQKIKETLAKIGTTKTSDIVNLGSVVYTSNLNYFILISEWELKAGNESFYAIYTCTPIGNLLLGKTVGDSISFRNQEFIINEVF